MNKEIQELKNQNTWQLVPKPEGIKPLKGRWVLRTKQPLNNSLIYKARQVTKGFQQKLGVDFNETFTNTINPVIQRLILSLAAYNNQEIEQQDIKSAYPNAPLSERIYIQ